jgi:hypothetical protein
LAPWVALGLAIGLLSGAAHGAEPAPPASVKAVSGRLLDEQTGQWGQEDVLSPAFVPVNQMGAPLLLMVAIDLGARCIVPQPSSDEVQAIAKGERQPPSRPRACDAPSGKLFVTIRYADGTVDRQSVPLARFFAGTDGVMHVPLLFYRRLVCQPVELAVWTSGQKRARARRIDFQCAE